MKMLAREKKEKSRDTENRRKIYDDADEKINMKVWHACGLANTYSGEVGKQEVVPIWVKTASALTEGKSPHCCIRNEGGERANQ